MDIENAQPLFEDYIKPYEAEIQSLRTQLAQAQTEKAELVRQCAEIYEDFLNELGYERYMKKYGTDNYVDVILSLLPKE